MLRQTSVLAWLVIVLICVSCPVYAAERPIPDCSDGTWQLIRQEINVLDRVPWSLGRLYVKINSPQVACLTLSLLWDMARPVYQTWGTLDKHFQSVQRLQIWSPPAKGSKMEHVLRVDEKDRVLSVVIMIYEGESERAIAWEKFANPLVDAPPASY